jgi:hypothetical protein
MRTGRTIDPDKLRLFCDNHGGIAHVAKTIGRTSTCVRHAIKVSRASEELLELLDMTYGFKDIFPGAPTCQVAPEPEPKKHPVTKTSVIDELIDEMIRPPIGLGSPAKEAEPATKTWREKTLAEMTGDDIDRLVGHVVSGVMANIMKELLTMNVQVSLKKEGGRYGW